MYAPLASSTVSADCNHGDIRLVGGNSPLEGRLEFCIGKAWGSVCGNIFSEQDARVVCRQLNSSSAQLLVQANGNVSEGAFGPGEGPLFLDEVTCNTGEEQRLEECGAQPIITQECSHARDVGVVCQGESVSSPFLSCLLGFLLAFLFCCL